MTNDDKDRATYIIRSEKLCQWLSGSERAEPLLINGCSDPREYISSLSFFCAQLAASMSAAKAAIVISYFCGRHMDLDRDRTANAQGMMVSLIGQLLSQQKQKGLDFDLSFIEDQDVELLIKDNLHTLCKIFRELVLQLPGTKVLFCIIDGISLYETLDRKKGTLYAMHSLTRLLRKASKGDGVLFKCLVTCPGRSLYIYDGNFVPEDILVVPEFIDGDGQGVWDMTDIEDSLNVSLTK